MRVIKVVLIGILALFCIGCENHSKTKSSDDSGKKAVSDQKNTEKEDFGKASEFFAYEIDQEKGTSSVTSYLDETEEEIRIPDSFSYEGKDYPVVSISESAFQGNSTVKKVDIPDTVTNIGQEAFCECDALESIEIPGSVTALGTGIFYDCSALKEVTVGKGVVSLSDEIFTNCYALEKITLPDTLTVIGDEVFWACEKLTELVLPQSVVSIGNRSFYGSGIKRLTIQSPSFVVSEDILDGADAVEEVLVPETLVEAVESSTNDKEIKVEVIRKP